MVEIPLAVIPPDGAEEIATLGAKVYFSPLSVKDRSLIPPSTIPAIAVLVTAEPTIVKVIL